MPVTYARFICGKLSRRNHDRIAKATSLVGGELLTRLQEYDDCQSVNLYISGRQFCFVTEWSTPMGEECSVTTVRPIDEFIEELQGLAVDVVEEIEAHDILQHRFGWRRDVPNPGPDN